MLERILRMYTMAMATGVTSPLPHIFGPPGTGKSTVIYQAAELLGVKAHVINLARISPLELEGVQMPITSEEEMKLKLLHATFWMNLEEGDIVLFDEFLRAFPEVFNGLLDIITSREVAGLVLPKVFFIAASNSTIAYDKALEDRLHHIPVPDARKLMSERNRIAGLLVNELGLLPDMATSVEMSELIDAEILPMYEMLDQLEKRGAPAVVKGRSVRNLIGQALLRDVSSSYLSTLISTNNQFALNRNKPQYVYLLDGRHAPPAYLAAIHHGLQSNPKLKEKQRRNIELNQQLIELAEMDRSHYEEDA